MPLMQVLIVAAREETRDLMRLAVRSIERRVGESVSFLDADNGERGRHVAMRRRPEAIVADEFASREGAFSLARTLRGDAAPYTGAIVILLDRKQDEWLARWSGADAWFVKPVDPFALADALVDAVLDRAAERTQEETA
jgi:DNA-binding response OmpR family regulator